MSKKIAISILLVAIVATIIYYFAVPRPLKGWWAANGVAGGISWSQSYAFDRNTYSIEGYPAMSEKGSYRITKTETVNGKTQYTLRMKPTTDKAPYDLTITVLSPASLQIGSVDGVFYKMASKIQ